MKVSRPSEVRLDPADLVDSDPVGNPMVDVRGRSHVRRFTLATQRRGPQRTRFGVALDVHGEVAPDEIEDVCAELLAMRDAAIAAQLAEDTDQALADEVDDLATRCTLVDLRCALVAPSDTVGDHDREVIHAAIELAERRAVESNAWGAGATSPWSSPTSTGPPTPRGRCASSTSRT